MANLNRTLLIGNITRDPEVRFTPKGTAVCEIGLAINRKYSAEGDNGLREETTFIDITFWAKEAETLGEYAKKGSQLYIEGRLQLDSWDDKETGKKRTKLKVTGERFQFLGSREAGGQANSSPAPAQARGNASVQPGAAEDGDEIPFSPNYL